MFLYIILTIPILLIVIGRSIFVFKTPEGVPEGELKARKVIMPYSIAVIFYGVYLLIA